MMPLKISEVRKSRVEDLKFKSAAVKRAGWPCFPVVPLSRFYDASNARNAAYECTRLKSADDISLSFSSFHVLFVCHQTRRIPDRNRRTVWQGAYASVVIIRPTRVNSPSNRSKRDATQRVPSELRFSFQQLARETFSERKILRNSCYLSKRTRSEKGAELRFWSEKFESCFFWINSKSKVQEKLKKFRLTVISL